MDIKVLLADDHAVLRDGLRMVLDAQTGISVVGEAEDGRQALEMVERLHPDVVVMDIAMPNMNGAEATRQIKRRFPGVKVLILTMHENEHYLAQIVNAGAIGCVLKRSAGTELVTAVRAAARGESYFSPAMATMMLDGYRMHLAVDGRDESDLLTEREREILQLVAEGKTNQEIADLLVVSIKTVQTHRAHMMEKLDAHDRTELVKHAIRLGMITSD
ncbi:MAG TPA: DNA-binding response regulator [Chloroflexi bacterium]|jgi:two-component system response regulator NreC|nr:DNA-binding response regulator [Chloroflexota bacterium]